MALDYFNNTIGGMTGVKGYLYNQANSGAALLGYSTLAYNPIPKTISVNFNSGQGIISLNASFDNAPFVSGYADFNWSVSTECGVNIFKPFASVNKNGSYLIQDFGIINRTSVNLNGDFSFPPTGDLTSLTKHVSMLNILKNLEGLNNAATESESYNLSSGDSIRSGFSYSYTRDGCAMNGLPVDGKIYSGVSI